MSEVGKMYKLANVKAINIAEYGSTYIPNSVEIDGNLYPPFTAKKQLELIKLLSEREIYITHAEGKYYIFTMNIGGSECSKKFDISLAKYINFVWQDLTEEERKQIKEILK